MKTRDEVLQDLREVKSLLPEELKLEIVALADKMSLLLREHSPNAVLFVLEAALEQNITNLSPALGELFKRMLDEYKQKATMLLTLSDMLMSMEDKNPEL